MLDMAAGRKATVSIGCSHIRKHVIMNIFNSVSTCLRELDTFHDEEGTMDIWVWAIDLS